jgi:hypothetical protein
MNMITNFLRKYNFTIFNVGLVLWLVLILSGVKYSGLAQILYMPFWLYGYGLTKWWRIFGSSMVIIVVVLATITFFR